MEGIGVRLLGAFAITVDGREFSTSDFERRSAAELVQFLAASSTRRRHKDQVLDGLWPDVEIETAKNRLYKATTFARRSLAAKDAVVVHGDILELFPGRDVSIDWVEFEDASDAGDVDRVLQLYRGDFLADDPYTEWTLAIRRRLTDKHRAALRAARRWHTLAELDPTDEFAHVELMREALESGDRSAVLHRFASLEGVLLTELGVAPGAEACELRDLARVEPEDDISAEEPSSGRRLTVDDRILGRDDTMKSLIETLDEHRLVTIVGPGGAGKTHLARHVGAAVVGHAWLCELGRLAASSAVGTELLSTVGGIHHVDTDAVQSAARRIGSERALLVVDNCEHVIESLRTALTVLLDSCDGLRILCTSRQALDLRSEIVVPLDVLERTASIEMFISEAARRGSRTDPDDPAIDRICSRLDDLPLAIQLAAARARSLGVEGVERLLDDRLDALRDDGEIGHHTTLRDAIDWSFDALSTTEQQVLVDVSMFADRFTLEGVLALGNHHDRTVGGTLDDFDHLVRCSLVVGPTPGPDGTTYRLLESVRLYARGQATSDTAARAHVTYVLGRITASRLMTRDDPDAAVRRFAFDRDDIARARQFAAGAGMRTEIAQLLADVAYPALYALRFEFLDWYDDGLGPDRFSIESEAHARAAGCAAVMVAYRGDVDQGTSLANAAHAVAPGDEVVLFALAWIALSTGNANDGRHWFEMIAADPEGTAGPLRSAALSSLSVIHARTESGGAAYRARLAALSGLGTFYRINYLFAHGYYAMIDGRVDEATELLEETVELAEVWGQRFTGNIARDTLALLAVTAGDDEQALEGALVALEWPRKNGAWMHAVGVLNITAHALIRFGELRAATLVLAASDDAIFSFRSHPHRVRSKEILRKRAPDDYDTWWGGGVAIGLPAAVDLAIATLEDVARNFEPVN